MALQFEGANGGVVAHPAINAAGAFVYKAAPFQYKNKTTFVHGLSNSGSGLITLAGGVLKFRIVNSDIDITIPGLADGDYVTDFVATRDVNNVTTVTCQGETATGTQTGTLALTQWGTGNASSSTDYDGIIYGFAEWSGAGIPNSKYDFSVTTGSVIPEIASAQPDATIDGFSADPLVANPGVVNSAPVVDAGATINVDAGAPFQLNGTASDPDGDPLTLLWEEVSASGTVLSDPTVLNPTGTAPANAAALTFRLTANDGSASTSDTVAVNVSAAIEAPASPYLRKLLIPVNEETLALENTDRDLLEGFKVIYGVWGTISDKGGQIIGRGSVPPVPYRVILKELDDPDFMIQMTVTNDLGNRVGGFIIRAVDENDFMLVFPFEGNTQLIHYSGGAFTTLETISNSAVDGIISDAVYNIRIRGAGPEITVYIDHLAGEVEVAKFVTAVNQNATKIGFNLQADQAPKFSDVFYSNDPTLASFSIPVESTPPVLTVPDPEITINAGDPYTQTATATDNQDGDISRFIETFSLDNVKLDTVDTSRAQVLDLILKVRDNNFNFSLASQRVIIDDGLALIRKANRMAQAKQNINLKNSRLELSIPGGETGLSTYLVQAHKNDEAGRVLVDAPVEFSNGEALVEVGEAVGFPFTGHILDGNYPQDRGIAIVGATTGPVRCFANEAIIGNFILPASGVIAIEGNLVLNGEAIFRTNTGAIMAYDKGYVQYCPDGVYDYLQPGDSAVETIEYLLTGNVTQSIDITILASESIGANVNTTATQTSIPLAYEEGTTYEVAFDVSGRTVGEVQPRAIGDTTEAPRYTYSKNGREVWHIKIPANCTTIDLVGTNGFDGAIDGLHVREVLKPATVVSPRRLDIHTINTRQQPAFASVEGTCVIEPILSPLLDPSGGFTYVENVNDDDLGFEGSRLGFRASLGGNYKFVDCTSREKKEAINLNQNGEIAYVDNLFAEGGFPVTETERWDFELGINLGVSSGTGLINTYVLNTYIDLKRDSINGQYSPPNNTDCINVPRDGTKDQARLATHLFNVALYNGGDGNTDGKTTIIFNYAETGKTYRNCRAHEKSLQIHANIKHVPYDEGYTGQNLALSCYYITNKFLIWNCEFDGQRINEYAQIEDNPERFEYILDAADKPQIFSILKTLPAIPDTIRSAFDEIEAEYKLSSDSTWIALPKIGVDHCGDLRWRPTLPTGTYDFRVRTRLRTQVSAWVENLGATI